MGLKKSPNIVIDKLKILRDGKTQTLDYQTDSQAFLVANKQFIPIRKML